MNVQGTSVPVYTPRMHTTFESCSLPYSSRISQCVNKSTCTSYRTFVWRGTFLFFIEPKRCGRNARLRRKILAELPSLQRRVSRLEGGMPVGFLQYSTLQRLEELEPCPIDPSNGSLPGKVQSYRLRWWCPLSCRLRDQEQLFEFHT